jgi:hypothetical protein
MKLSKGTAIPMKIAQEDDAITKVVSGGEKVEIIGSRPFVLGRGPDSKGVERYWFAFWKRGTPKFRIMKPKQAEKLLGMSEKVGKKKRFKTPGWQTPVTAATVKEVTKSKQVRSRMEAVEDLAKLGYGKLTTKKLKNKNGVYSFFKPVKKLRMRTERIGAVTEMKVYLNNSVNKARWDGKKFQDRKERVLVAWYTWKTPRRIKR